jgi:localization factor PodJL
VPTSPWSVKGIDRDARAAAKLAARRSGLTLGAWLNQMIRETAGEQLRQYGPRVEPAHAEPPPRVNGVAAAPVREHVPPAELQAIHETLQRLAQRMEAAETRTSGMVEPIADQLRDLRLQVSETRGRPGITTAPFERALLRLAERLDRLEGTSDAGEAPHRRLREAGG